MLSAIYLSSTLSYILVPDTLVLTTHDLRKYLYGVPSVFYSFDFRATCTRYLYWIFFITIYAMFLGSVLSEQLACIC